MLRFDFYKGDPSRTIILLHGLFGSAKNLSALAKDLSGQANIYAYDARNHGHSHHTETHNLDELVQDLKEFIVEHNIVNPILIGHSMGALTAMAYAGTADQLQALVVLDIAPRTYPPGHEQEIAAQSMMISDLKSRREIDELMQKILPDATLRQFIQTNIERDETGQYVWMNNIQAIAKSKSRTAFPSFKPPLYSGPTLVVRGLKSDYVTEADAKLMRAAFPRLQLVDIPDAGHWLHYTHAELVRKHILQFLSSI